MLALLEARGSNFLLSTGKYQRYHVSFEFTEAGCYLRNRTELLPERVIFQAVDRAKNPY